MNTIVLGGGPSALAYLYYDHEAVALAGKALGGQFAQSRDLGPQLLWESEYTKNILVELGLSDELRPISVGYFFNGTLRHGKELGPSLSHAQAAYAMKTRGTAPEGTFLSEGKTEYSVYKTTVEELVSALAEKVRDRCVLASATQVFTDSRQVAASDGTVRSYDVLVSTVPAPVLLNLAEPKPATRPDLKAFDKIYVKALGHAVEPWMKEAKDREFEYVYVPGDDCPFHRVKVSDGAMILEYTMKNGVGVTGIGVVTQPNGQIVSGQEELKSWLPAGIKTLGRYASWNRDKFHDVLKRIVSGGLQ